MRFRADQANLTPGPDPASQSGFPGSASGAAFTHQPRRTSERQSIVKARQIDRAVDFREPNDGVQPFQQLMTPRFVPRPRLVEDLGCVRINDDDVGEGRHCLVFLQLAKHVEVPGRGGQNFQCE